MSRLILLALVIFAGSSLAETAAPSGYQPTFRMNLKGQSSFSFVTYGDMRFTAPNETEASRPTVRRALIERIATDHPVAIFLNGDVPWHGGTVDDYAVYANETTVWRDAHIPVYPALGNHEFAQCSEERCLENWWTAFPDLKNRRWYSVEVGDSFVAIALDTDTSLLAGSPQRQWLEEQLETLPRSVRYVLLFMHHPPVASIETGALANHNPRSNEVALADYLKGIAPRARARVLVCAGHIHNYERHEQDGVTYLVSGGGGAKPYPVTRDATERYAEPSEPNFHYLRVRVTPQAMEAEMIRLEDPAASLPHEFEVRDRFVIKASN
jgi:acid phosphatase type 7